MDRGVELTIFTMGATLMLCLALVIIGVFGNDDGVLGYGFIYGQGEQIGCVSEVANNGVFWKPPPGGTDAMITASYLMYVDTNKVHIVVRKCGV